MNRRMERRAARQCLLIVLSCGVTAIAQTSTPGDYQITSDTDSATIPFKMVGHDIVLTVEINGKELHLGLDNGSLWDQLFLYGSPRIDALGLQNDGMKVQIAGAGDGPMPAADMAFGFTIRLPGVELRNQSAIIASAESGLADLFKGEDGSISGSLFKHFVVRIDFDRKVIVLTEPERFQAPSSADALTLTPIGMGAYTIPCTVQLSSGKTLSLNPGIDLGSVNPSLIFVGEGREITSIPEGTIKTSLGVGVQGEIVGPLGRVRSLRLGKHTLADVVTGFTRASLWPGNGDDGLVGLPVFSKFHVTFDYNNERMYLEPNRRFTDPFEADMSGLTFRSGDDGGLVISRIIPGSPASEVGMHVGDTVLQIDGKDVHNLEYLDILRLLCQPGKTITFEITRNDEKRKLHLKLRRLI